MLRQKSCCPTSLLFGKKQWNCCNLLSDFLFFLKTYLWKKWMKRWTFELNSVEFADRLETVKKYWRKGDILNVLKWIIVSMWVLWVPFKAHYESKPSLFLLIFYIILVFFILRLFWTLHYIIPSKFMVLSTTLCNNAESLFMFFGFWLENHYVD